MTGVSDLLTQVPGDAGVEGVEWRWGRFIAIFPIARRCRRGLADWPVFHWGARLLPPFLGPPASISERMGPLGEQTPLPLLSPRGAQACLSPSPTAPVCPELLRMA